MPIVIRDQALNIDIRAELEQYDWTRPRWTSDKLQAASPFRYENKPSFFVNLDGQFAGTWADLGAYDSEWASGNFVKLLAFLRQETYEETEEYLLEAYGIPVENDSIIIRPPRLQFREPFRPLDESIVTPAFSPYLSSRGISEDVQRMYGVGYGRQKGFVAMPWRLADGRLANVMYRATRGKVFFYERGGWPRRKLVYGIDVVQREQAKEAAICEAPIDALSWATMGVLAVAVGGVTFSQEQADIIKRSSIKTVILGGDNDKAGAKLNTEIERKLSGHVRFKRVDYGGAKDANEALVGGRSVNVEKSSSNIFHIGV